MITKDTFFKHSPLARYEQLIKRLAHDYRGAGVRFYWECVELLAGNGGWHWKTQVEGLHCNKMSIPTIDSILETSGLFEIVDDRVVLMALGVRNGIVDFEESVFVRCRDSRPWAREGTEAPAGAPTGGPAGGPAEGPAGGPAGEPVRPGPIELEREEEIERRHRLTSVLNKDCPHLQMMEQPLSLEEYDELVNSYGKEAVRSVLLSMENETGLSKRSCYLTALSWLKRRTRT